MRNYTDLEIYKIAFNLTIDIYKLTNDWPRNEEFGLISQIRRSAHSVDSNICEGASRIGDKDCLRFISNAYSSLKETENHLRLAKDLGFITDETFREYLARIDTLLAKIYRFMQSSNLRNHQTIYRRPTPDA